jgi:hypothetical protein
MVRDNRFAEAAAKARELVKNDAALAATLGMDGEMHEMIQRYDYLTELAALAARR